MIIFPSAQKVYRLATLVLILISASTLVAKSGHCGCPLG